MGEREGKGDGEAGGIKFGGSAKKSIIKVQ